MTSFSATFSSERSAYIRLSRLCSCSNSFSRFISEASSPPVLGLPLIVGGGADPVFPPDLVDRATGIGFFQHRHDLRFSELRLAHGNLLAKGGYSARKFSFRTVSVWGELTLLLHRKS